MMDTTGMTMVCLESGDLPQGLREYLQSFPVWEEMLPTVWLVNEEVVNVLHDIVGRWPGLGFVALDVSRISWGGHYRQRPPSLDQIRGILEP